MYQCLDCRHIFEIEAADIAYNYDDESFDCCPKCGGEELIQINEDSETASSRQKKKASG